MRELIMTWKINEDGNIATKDGNPVCVDSTGEERIVQYDTISRLNKEAKEHREKGEAALKQLKLFEGIDPEKARNALETVSKYNAKELIDAGKVDEVKMQITSKYEQEIKERDARLKALQDKYDDMLVNNVFASSEFIKNNVAVPMDMFQAKFRSNLKVDENGQVVVLDSNGQRLYSKERAGEYATPEEGLRILTEAHPNKDVIIKANVGSGSGNKGNGASATTGNRYITRSDFEALNPVEQAAVAKEITSGKKTLLTS